jgi:mannose-1-phosphate guanylyltransferase
MTNTWALVLAAGEGSRLRALTTQHGVAVPKQFCSLAGGPSLLEEAIQRAGAIVPRQRVCTIVADQHRAWWEPTLRFMPRRNVVVQPQNRGTAIGLLLPLLHIAQRDPHARVVILPSDHHVRDEAVLARALRRAATRIGNDAENVWLLGIAPEEADPELGYIVPGSRDETGALEVMQFVEKPSMTLARLLIERGGLWNAFILAGAVEKILGLFARRYPELLNEMRTVVQRDATSPDEPVAASDLYPRLPELDFSRHVLEGSEATLRVLPVPACGWSDLGTPRRVSEALRRLNANGVAKRETASKYLNLAAQHARLQLAV